MAKPTAPEPAPQEAPPESQYPVIESFVERATPEEVAQFFQPVRDGLASLKGPRKDQAKKVEAALSRTEELLSHLLEVRERLLAEKSDRAKSLK
jgi:hypothetical protein